MTDTLPTDAELRAAWRVDELERECAELRRALSVAVKQIERMERHGRAGPCRNVIAMARNAMEARV